jgi:hypothetical protein
MKKKTLLSAVAFVATFGFAGSAMAGSTASLYQVNVAEASVTGNPGSMHVYQYDNTPRYGSDVTRVSSSDGNGWTSVANRSSMDVSFYGKGSMMVSTTGDQYASQSRNSITAVSFNASTLSVDPAGCCGLTAGYGNYVSSVGGAAASSGIGTVRAGRSNL